MEDATPELSARVKEVLAQRRAQKRAAEAYAQAQRDAEAQAGERKRQALLPPPPPPEPSLPAVLETADTLRLAFQKTYYGVLLEPEVVSAVRAQLRSKDKRAAQAMLATLLTSLQPQEKAASGNKVSVVFQSKIARPQARDITVEARKVSNE